MFANEAPELTASLSEAFKGLRVADCARDDNLDTRTKIEEHANGGDQRIGGDFVICLQLICQWRCCNSDVRGVTNDICADDSVVRMLLEVILDP